MLDLSVEDLKILMYWEQDLFIAASKSKFLMSICLQSKGFKVHMHVNLTALK